MEIRIRKGDYQDRFLSSKSKFPALIAGIGTGKTLCLLTKIYDYCEIYPGTTALVVRKEFTDLKDSTIKDFQNYFQCTVGSDKDYKLPNGSIIMFRHAAEIQVLKNINLGIAGIEQAEEFDDDTQFQFLRDRLRQNNGATVRPLLIIANANGHNWIWKHWINNVPSSEYEAICANTFENERNLPPDFIQDLKRMEVEAPSHYRQYIMNSFEETEQDDFVFTYQELLSAKNNIYLLREKYGFRIAGFDIARYGNDKCACCILQQMGAVHWEVSHLEQWEHKDLNYTTGRILSIVNEYNVNKVIIDEDGIGAGPLDTLNKGRQLDYITGFRNPSLSYEANNFYANPRTANAFKVKDYILKGHIYFTDDDLINELATLKFTFDNNQRRILVSKEKMRKEGIKSPNMADALIMAMSVIGEVKLNQDKMYFREPSYAKEDNLFKLAGIQ
jgi:hypothetical protein